MLPETIGQLFVGGMDQPFSCMKVWKVVCCCDSVKFSRIL